MNFIIYNWNSKFNDCKFVQLDLNNYVNLITISGKSGNL